MSFSFLSAALFTLFAVNVAKSPALFGCIKRQPQAWWSPEVKEAVKERQKAFSVAHSSDKNRQAYISASRHASIFPKLVYFLLFLLLFLLLPFLSELFQLLFFQGVGIGLRQLPKISRFCLPVKGFYSTARGLYLSKLRQTTCPDNFHSSFCSSFFPIAFVAAAANHSSSTTTGADKVANTMLKHLFWSGIDFLLHIF